jgi:hypothetical protein
MIVLMSMLSSNFSWSCCIQFQLWASALILMVAFMFLSLQANVWYMSLLTSLQNRHSGWYITLIGQFISVFELIDVASFQSFFLLYLLDELILFGWIYYWLSGCISCMPFLRASNSDLVIKIATHSCILLFAAISDPFKN